MIAHSNIRLSGLTLDYAATPNRETFAVANSGANNSFDNFYIRRAGIALEFTRMAGAFFSAFQIWDYAEAVTVSNGDILGEAHGLVTSATNNAVRARPSFSKFNNVYFDSSSQEPALIRNATDLDFTNVWFSGGRPAPDYAGADLANTVGIRFTNAVFINNGGNGATVHASASRTAFVNSTFTQNEMSEGDNPASGLVFEPGTSDFVVTGSTLSNSVYTPAQRFGVHVQRGSSDRYVIANHLVSGNREAGVRDEGTGKHKSVSANY